MISALSPSTATTRSPGTRMSRPVNAYEKGNPEATIETTLKSKFGTLDKRLQTMMTYVFACHRPKLTMFGDARSCIALANSSRVKTGIAAGGNPGIQKLKMQALKADQLMDSIIYAGNLAGDNKMTDAVSMSCMLLDADPCRTVYVASQYSESTKEITDLGVKVMVVNRDNQSRPGSDSFLSAGLQVVNSLLDILATPAAKVCQETYLAKTA